jgi:hypothetical protein
MKKLIFSLVFALFVISALLGNSYAETIDFEGLAAGTIVASVFGDSGSGPILVQGTNPSLAAGTNAAVIFDSSNPTGDDSDLGTPNENFGGPGIGSGGEAGSFANTTALGNLLIVAEDLVDSEPDGLVDDPDDADEVGASIRFDFSAVGSGSVTIDEITIIDVEASEPSATVELFNGPIAPANLIANFTLTQTGDNGVSIESLGPTSGVVTMLVTLNGSGGIDNIVFTLEVGGEGRFTGGGHQLRAGEARVTRGLTVHCDLLLSNNLEVNWNGNSFHMTEHLLTVECSDDPLIIQDPPAAPLDTLIGVGIGDYNNQAGFTIEFTLVDAGEPGRDVDKAALLIFETGNPGNVILDVPLQLLTGGNLNAHFDQPHK